VNGLILTADKLGTDDGHWMKNTLATRHTNLEEML